MSFTNVSISTISSPINSDISTPTTLFSSSSYVDITGHEEDNWETQSVDSDTTNSKRAMRIMVVVAFALASLLTFFCLDDTEPLSRMQTVTVLVASIVCPAAIQYAQRNDGISVSNILFSLLGTTVLWGSFQGGLLLVAEGHQQAATALFSMGSVTGLALAGSPKIYSRCKNSS